MWKKQLNSYTVFTIIAIILASLITGCSLSMYDEFDPPEFVFVPEASSIGELSGGLQNINNLHISGEKLYFSSSTGLEKIYMMNFDGSDLTALPNFFPTVHPDVTDSYVFVSDIHVDNDGYIYVVERVSPMIWDPQDSGMKIFFILRKFDSLGMVMLEVDLTNEVFGNSNVLMDKVCVDDSGNIYISTSDNIYMLSNEGRFIFSLNSGHGSSSINHLIRMPDGTVSMATNHPTGVIIREINTESRTFGQTVTIPILGDYSIFPGNEQFIVLLSDAFHLFGIDVETGETVEVLNWIDSDVSSAGVNDIIMQDNRIMLVRQNWDWVGGLVTELVLLTKTPYADLPQKTLLTLATFESDSHRESVLEFNRKSETHRIQIIDYSVYNTRDDMTAGLTRLTTEIIAGKVPDILDVTYLPFEQFASRGLFIDLYTFIDSDPEMNRDSFVESVLKAAEIDGQLYRMFPEFSISTLVGHPSVVGSNPGWDFNEFKATLTENSQATIPLGEAMTKEVFLQNVFMFSMEQFVDWDTGIAHFDSDEFIELLEFADTFPLYPSREYNYYTEIWTSHGAITSNQQILFPMVFAGYSEFLLTRTIFGGELVFKGFPPQVRNGSAFVANGGLAVTTACTDKQGAWEFLKTFLTEDWQRMYWGSSSFPVNSTIFEQHLTEALEVMGEQWSGGPTVDGTIYIPNLTEDEAEQIVALINSIDTIISQDVTLWNIVIESVSDYFHGKSSLQDTVRIIQNRASTYMSEQSG